MQAKKSPLASGLPNLTIQIPHQGAFSHVSQQNLRILKLERQMAGGKSLTRSISELNKVVPQRGTYFRGLLFSWIGSKRNLSILVSMFREPSILDYLHLSLPSVPVPLEGKAVLKLLAPKTQRLYSFQWLADRSDRHQRVGFRYVGEQSPGSCSNLCHFPALLTVIESGEGGWWQVSPTEVRKVGIIRNVSKVLAPGCGTAETKTALTPGPACYSITPLKTCSA